MTKKEMLATIKTEGEAAGLSRSELNGRFVYPLFPGSAPSLSSLNKSELGQVLTGVRKFARDFAATQPQPEPKPTCDYDDNPALVRITRVEDSTDPPWLICLDCLQNDDPMPSIIQMLTE